MSASHNRRGSARAALQRRSTKGPLDVDDPLSDSQSHSATVSPPDPSTSPLVASTELDTSLTEPLTTSQTATEADLPPLPTNDSRDLSFLLDASIYHPLTNIDLPPAFRHPLPPTPAANVSLRKVFSELADLLKQCHLLSAAHLAAAALTSGLVGPNDSTSIFRLLSIRYSALELSGNVLLAAQESKALEDLSSSFYYNEVTLADNQADPSQEQQSIPKHIMPFDLRLQALRLQGIGFSDSRRAVGALFDLGMECRENLMKATTEEKKTWEERLEEVGMRVVNTLIDMGDLDCARRTLLSMRPGNGSRDTMWVARTVLLLIKMGEMSEARALLDAGYFTDANRAVLLAIVQTADGDFQEAVKTLSQPAVEQADQAALAIAKQNLAVAHLYIGNIQQSRQILEDLVDKKHSFQALTVNLATLYDLMSDKSKDLKEGLVTKIAQTGLNQPQRGFINADFKL